MAIAIGGARAQSCCCVSAGANYSITPNVSKNLIGARYSYASLQMITHSLNPDINGRKTVGHISQLELSGRFNLNEKLRLSVFLPAIIINQHSASSSQRSAGLGDITLLLQYALLNPQRCNKGESKHQVRLGIGSKLPSGEFKKNENNLYNTSVQPGSGSIDFIANGTYTYRFRNFGFNLSGLYKLNTPNTYSFRFGNKAETSLNLFYLVNLPGIELVPGATVSFSHLFANYNNGEKVYASNSTLLTTTLGIDIYLPHVAVSLNLSPTVYSKVPPMSFKQRFNGEVAVYYSFSKNKKQ